MIRIHLNPDQDLRVFGEFRIRILFRIRIHIQVFKIKMEEVKDEIVNFQKLNQQLQNIS